MYSRNETGRCRQIQLCNNRPIVYYYEFVIFGSDLPGRVILIWQRCKKFKQKIFKAYVSYSLFNSKACCSVALNIIFPRLLRETKVKYNMGSFLSKTVLEEMCDIEQPLAENLETPTRLRKVGCVVFDPRSPTLNIDRTPILVRTLFNVFI